jgi:heparan-alpha-glucosaminide N-acetyltransferase
MTTVTEMSATNATIYAGSPRVVSIDVFRGVTIAVMIFVNALSSVPGLPWWTYHAPASADFMTYVDMVFPFFLFIVGMSLPLSASQRLKRNPSMWALWLHIVARVGGLVTLGLILANAEKADPSRMGFSGSWWAIVALLSAGIYLNIYPTSGRLAAYTRSLRLIGLVGVALMLALFRRATHDNQTAWIDGSYPEILGLIGYSFLGVAILYMPTRRLRWAPYAWLVLLLGLCALSTRKVIQFPDHVPLYIWPFGNGAMASIIVAGIITSSIFLRSDGRNSPRRAMSLAAGFALIVLGAGRVLSPLGISKIRATPTWSLYSIGAAVLVFTALYWICDVKHWIGWAAFLRPAGSNTLLTYLLPDLWYFLFTALGATYLDTHLNQGWPAIIKTLTFTLLILALAAGLTKARVRLQL